ncbi:MAG: hypothetical protein ACK5WX_07190 [bacterium]|jgi:hypothetical protein
MQPRSIARRGNCLVTGLIGIGVLGLLFLIGGVILIAIQGPKASAGFKPLSDFSSKGEFLEAPGTVETTLAAGNLVVVLSSGNPAMFPPEKTPKTPIPAPPLGVTYTVTVTGSDGKAIEFKSNNETRDLADPFYLLGTAEIPADGSYKIEVKASDDKTPAGIVIASMASADFDTMKSAVFPLFWSFIGCGGACCGGLIGLLGLIGAMIAKKVSAPPADPLAL